MARTRYYLNINDGRPPIDITGLGTIIIGRNPLVCNILISDSQSSRIQCIIDIQREPVIITDGDGLRKTSKNGTKIIEKGNKTKIKLLRGNSSSEKGRTSLLNNGDLICIGKIQITFVIKKPQINDEADSDINITH